MKYTTYLRWGVLAALFAALFVPFIIADGGAGKHGLYIGFWNLFFPYITGKNFAFRIIVEFGVLCYALLALREPKYRPQASTILWTVLAFVAWMAIATVLSVDPLKSFWSNFERMEGYVGLLHLFAWFVMAGAVLSVDKLWERFFNVSIFASALMGLDALMQLVGWVAISSQSGPRVDTTFGNATYLAVYLLIHVFLTLFMLARSGKQPWLQAFYGVAVVLQVTGLYFTETRGALLGLAGGLIVAALWMAVRGKGREWKALRAWSVGIIVLLVVLGGAFLALRDSSLVQQSNTLRRLADISLTDRTTQARFLIWDMARQGALEKPIFGWGQENFNFVFNKYYNPEMYDQEAWFDRAHDEFLDWLIAGGVPAFLLYIALYCLAVWAILRSDLNVAEQAAFVGLLAGYAFNNLFVFDNLVSAMYFFMLLAYCHSLSLRKMPSLSWSKPLGDHAIAIVAPIVAGVVLAGGWALNAPGLARAMTLVDAIQTQALVVNAQGQQVPGARDPKSNLASFNEALGSTLWPGSPLGVQETTEQLLQFASNLASQNVDPATKASVYEAAYNAGIALLTARPGDARLELFVATFLSSIGQQDEAQKHLRAAIADSPKKQQILFQVGASKLAAGDKQGALDAFKTAYDLEPKYDSAIVFYAAGLYSVGQSAAADALITARWGSVAPDSDLVLNMYVNIKLYDRAAAIWRARIAKDPQNVQLHLSLASMYFNAGRKQETIAELRKIIELQPAAAAQMQQLIDQINNGTLKPGQ